MDVRLPWCIALGQNQGSWGDVALWSGVLIVFLIVGAVVVALVRRSMALSDEDDAADGFTLHGLRQLRARGEISESEFERAKAALIARIKAAAEPSDEAENNRPTDEKPTVGRQDLPAGPDRSDDPGPGPSEGPNRPTA